MNEYGIFNVIMGATKKTVIEELGKPDLNLSSLLIYRKPVGTLAVLFDEDMVKAFALYDTDKKLLYKNGIENLADKSKLEDVKEDIGAEALTERFGKPHFDIGSGMTRFGYFAQDDIVILPSGGTGIKSLLDF